MYPMICYTIPSIRSEADKTTNPYNEDDSVTKSQRQNIANEQANPNTTLVNTQMVRYWSSKQNCTCLG